MNKISARQLTAAMLLSVFLVLSIQIQTVFAEDAKELFDLYQSKYRVYREAVESGSDRQTLARLAEELQAACKDYYRAIGVESSFDAQDEAVTSTSEVSRAMVPEEVSLPATKKSELRRKYESILAGIAGTDRDKNLAQIQKQLEQFVADCPAAE
jgi:hypothetical protein